MTQAARSALVVLGNIAAAVGTHWLPILIGAAIVLGAWTEATR